MLVHATLNYIDAENQGIAMTLTKKQHLSVETA
jgi:hypothetical protein